MKLAAHNLTCGYGRKTVIRDISFELSSGETVCLLGPNGVGKTTFFKTLLGFLKPQDGRITADGYDLSRMSVQSRAKLMAYVPQAHQIPFPFSAQEVVVMGRSAHLGAFSSPSRRDREIARACMDELAIDHLRDRCFTQLSGGEQQLVLIARALAQESHFLVMDEPASNLDFGNQVHVLNHINRLRKQSKGILLTTHSPDHVFLCGTQVAVFHRDRRMEFGAPHAVITRQLLRDLYGVDARIHEVNAGRDSCMKVCVPCL